MMIPENDPFPRQLPKRRRVLLAHKIGPHSIPNDNHHVSICLHLLMGEAALST
jgi:hypothetical protein